MTKICHQSYFNFEFDKSSPKIISSTIKEVLLLSKKYIDKPINHLKVLDVGAGAGQYSFEIERYVKKVIAVEPFEDAYKEALLQKKKNHSRVIFKNSLIEDFKGKSKYDIVLCLSILEHMPHPQKSFKRIFELLNDGGIIYLTAPNKLWPIEVHYGLLFLSWLPLPLANIYLRASGKGKSYEDCSYAMTYFEIINLFKRFPNKYTFLVPDEESPYLGLGTTSPIYKTVKNFGIKLLRKFPMFWIISKGFIVVAQKSSRL